MKHGQDLSKMDLLRYQWITQNMDYPTMEYETLGKYKEEPQKIQRRNLGLACVAC